MTRLVALLCNIVIAVAAQILDAIEPRVDIDAPLPEDFQAWTEELSEPTLWEDE